MYADSMAFFAKQAEPPRFDPDYPPSLSYALLTSAPPLPPMSIEETFKRHEEFKQDCLASTRTRPVLWRDHLELYNDRIGCVFGFQHTPPGLTVAWTQKFAEAGVRFMALAYKEPTEYGYGFAEDGPLTDAGKRAIEWMNAYGITLDVSHLSNRTAYEALRFVEREELPMKPCASHSGCRKVYGHPRNLEDEVLYLLGQLHGYVGIPTISFFLLPKQNLASFYDEFVKQLEYARTVCGNARVGIGSDGIHMNLSLNEARANLERMMVVLESKGEFQEYHPDREPALIQDGLYMFPKIEEELVRRKWSRGAIRDVCGGSFIEYLKRALPA